MQHCALVFIFCQNKSHSLKIISDYTGIEFSHYKIEIQASLKTERNLGQMRDDAILFFFFFSLP